MNVSKHAAWVPTSGDSHSRRRFLQHAAAAAGAAFSARYALAAPAASDHRFVFILLRGALDGLAAVPPYADPDYSRLRGTLAIARPGGSDGALPLDGSFGL